MELPDSVVGKSVAEGHIYVFNNDCPIGIGGHMHVCIKHHNKYLIFSTCSSKILKSINLAKRRGYNINTYPVISPDDCNCFTKPTYVNCNQVWQLDEEEFGKLYKEGKIENTQGNGNIDAAGMIRISNGIKLSTEIADEIKEWFE